MHFYLISNIGVDCFFLIPVSSPKRGVVSFFILVDNIWFQLMNCHFFRKIHKYCLPCSGQYICVYRRLLCQYFDCKLRLWELSIFFCLKLTFLLCVLKLGQFLGDGFYCVTEIVTVLYCLFWVLYLILSAAAAGWKTLVVMAFTEIFLQLIKNVKWAERRKSSKTRMINLTSQNYFSLCRLPCLTNFSWASGCLLLWEACCIILFI